jgi:hypothetical protein
LARNRILEIYTQGIVAQFTDRAQAMLSLLAWHFDPEAASISSELLQFLAKPLEQLHPVCTQVYPRYNSIYRAETLEHFKEKFCSLLTRLPLLVLNGLENFLLGGVTFSFGGGFSLDMQCIRHNECSHRHRERNFENSQ